MKRKQQKRQPGPKPKLRDKRTREKFLERIRGGLSVSQSCRLVPCTFPTYRSEYHRDKEFADQVEQARTEFVAAIIGHVVRHAATDPATARHLAACFDKRFRKPKDAPAVTINNQQAVIVSNDPIYLPPEQRGTLLISLMGNAADQLQPGAKGRVVESSASQAGDGAITGPDPSDAAKILPS